MGFEEQAKALGFIDMINESVHTNDDVDIGDVDAVNRHSIAVKRWFILIHYYYIPIYKVEGWDGNVLRLKIEEYEVTRKYEVDKVPDPYRYYVKDYPYYTFDYYPVLPTIPSKLIIQSSYPNSLTATTVTAENLNVIQCDLCNNRFGSEDELSNHLSKDHN